MSSCGDDWPALGESYGPVSSDRGDDTEPSGVASPEHLRVISGEDPQSCRGESGGSGSAVAAAVIGDAHMLGSPSASAHAALRQQLEPVSSPVHGASSVEASVGQARRRHRRHGVRRGRGGSVVSSGLAPLSKLNARSSPTRSHVNQESARLAAPASDVKQPLVPADKIPVIGTATAPLSALAGEAKVAFEGDGQPRSGCTDTTDTTAAPVTMEGATQVHGPAQARIISTLCAACGDNGGQKQSPTLLEDRLDLASGYHHQGGVYLPWAYASTFLPTQPPEPCAHALKDEVDAPVERVRRDESAATTTTTTIPLGSDNLTWYGSVTAQAATPLLSSSSAPEQSHEAACDDEAMSTRNVHDVHNVGVAPGSAAPGEPAVAAPDVDGNGDVDGKYLVPPLIPQENASADAGTAAQLTNVVYYDGSGGVPAGYFYYCYDVYGNLFYYPYHDPSLLSSDGAHVVDNGAPLATLPSVLREEESKTEKKTEEKTTRGRDEAKPDYVSSRLREARLHRKMLCTANEDGVFTDPSTGLRTRPCAWSAAWCYEMVPVDRPGFANEHGLCPRHLPLFTEKCRVANAEAP